ncbi:MAG: TlpA disulfide reductase family protein [Phycisphaerales bacterium]
MRWNVALAGLMLLAVPRLSAAQLQVGGIVGQAAPSWGVAQWTNLPQDKKALDLSDFSGKVLYLYCFQSWCPGCRQYGFSTLVELVDRYETAEDVAFVAVQTVFEGYQINTAQAGWRMVQEFGLNIPIGHDGSNGKRSILMRRYRTRGTPWAIIIDKQGTVRFNGFHIAPDDAAELIDHLRDESPIASAPIKTLPLSRGGQDRVGTRFPKLDFDSQLRADAEPGDPKEVRATLYRWWTNTCPYCQASLPAIEKLRKEYGPKGLRVVGVYHPKPQGKVDDEAVLAMARRFGYKGELAIDADWSQLRKAYLSSGRRRATSVTFLVDKDGMIRFLHPGPVLFPSEDPQYEIENDDYQLLKQAIEALLRSDESVARRSIEKPKEK